MLGATVTRTDPDAALLASVEDPFVVTDEQVAVSCMAGVVTFKLDDGTLLEFDEVELNGALFFAAHEDAA